MICLRGCVRNGLALLLFASAARCASVLATHGEFVNLIESQDDVPVIVKFFSQTCVPCKRIAPVFDELAEQYSGRASFASIDAFQNQETPQALGITGIPAFHFFVHGKLVHSFQDADADQLRSWTERLTSSALPSPQVRPQAGELPDQMRKAGSPPRSPAATLATVSEEDLRKELDRRLASKDAELSRSENPCAAWRRKARGQNTENVVIIGGGPGGAAAAIYAARAGLCPLVVAPAAGGQLMSKGVDVENYPGIPDESGAKMLETMLRQARSFSAEFRAELVRSVNASTRPFEIGTESGSVIKAQSIILATGSQARWLDVEGEYEFKGHGVSGCATCDGFLFRGKECAVIGGGDTAMEEALVLSRLCYGVTLLHRRDELRASQVLRQRVLSNPKITVRYNTEVTQFAGTERVMAGGRVVKQLTHILLRDTNQHVASRLDVSAAFVAIGHNPNTKFLADQVVTDSSGYLVLEKGCTRTSVPGIFAAGDVADPVYQQAVTSCGSGAMSALDAERYVNELPVMPGDACPNYASLEDWRTQDVVAEAANKGLACSKCYRKNDYIEMLRSMC